MNEWYEDCSLCWETLIRLLGTLPQDQKETALKEQMEELERVTYEMEES